MKFFRQHRNTHILLILALITLVPIGLHLYQSSAPCFNSDEASFAYNAFSLTQTAKDEYGKLFPFRFLAFGENKLPITIYLMAPFMFLFGLSEEVARLPFMLIGILAPIGFYLLSKHLTGNLKVGMISALLAAISPWIQIMSRHIHENLIMFALTIGIIIALSKLLKKTSLRLVTILSFSIGIGLFTYHIGKVIALFTLLWTVGILVSKKLPRKVLVKSILILSLPVCIFFLTEFLAPSSRVANLVFWNNPGFTLRIEELQNADGNRIVHNKLTHGIVFLAHQYISYFSPEFLVIKGDANLRFGTEGVSPITPLEVLLVFVGIFATFRAREKSRFLMLSLLLTAPLAASLSWQERSLTRSFLMIIPLLFYAGYGIHYLAGQIPWKRACILFFATICGGIIFFSSVSWEYYFHHYLKRPETSYAWQCGYREIGQYIQTAYDQTDEFYITKKLGQPYIFVLFYTQFSPQNYQKQARLSAPDEYGFGQVETFDKFIFSLPETFDKKNTVYIGYPEEFPESVARQDVTPIQSAGRDIFWIYEGSRNK